MVEARVATRRLGKGVLICSATKSKRNESDVRGEGDLAPNLAKSGTGGRVWEGGGRSQRGRQRGREKEMDTGKVVKMNCFLQSRGKQGSSRAYIRRETI